MLKSFRANKKKSRHINNGIKQVLVTYQAKHSGDGQETYFAKMEKTYFCKMKRNGIEHFAHAVQTLNVRSTPMQPEVFIALYCILPCTVWILLFCHGWRFQFFVAHPRPKQKGTVWKWTVSCSSTLSQLGWKKDERRKKEEKESDENWSNWDYWLIMEQLVGKGFEYFEGTSSIAQWRRS